MSNEKCWPRISVVTPSYNQGRFLEECVRSVLDQDYPNLEYIVIDGGSTDGSVEIIQKYEKHLNYWVSEPDRGQAHAINKGFRKATGEILAWLNADDMYSSQALETVGWVLGQCPKAAVLCGSCLLVDEKGKTIGIKRPRELTPTYLLQGGSVPGQPAVFFRRKVLEQVGNLNESLHYVLDWELWLRISLYYPPETSVQLDEVLAQARIWSQAKTATAGTRGIEERQMILKQLLTDSRLPNHLRRLRPIACSDICWRWAFLHWQESRYLAALSYMLQAVWEHPRPAMHVRKLRHLARSIRHRRPVLS